MNEYLFYLITSLLISVSIFFTNLANADTAALELHVDAKMQHQELGPVDKAYGYVHLQRDPQGTALIDVMFSNASHYDGARFNARIVFVDAVGTVVKEEIINTRVGSPKADAAVEHKVSKALKGVDFENIEVEFYLSDFLYPVTAGRQGDSYKL